MTSNRIPLHRVQGTHYEYSYQLGQLTRESIRQRIANDFAYLSSLFHFIQTEYGQKLHRGFIETTRSIYPWYWDEIRGLADGSQVPLEQIVILNFLNETRTVYRLLDEKKKLENETGEQGCTTVLINRKDTKTLSLLHNEDHSSALYMTGCLVEADIQSSKYDNDQRDSPKEKFVAYCYAGSIPGNAFGVNVHGFVCALNGLYPDFVVADRLPRQIVNRALLSVKNEDELDKLLQSSPVAYGFCINGGFLRQPTHLLNYEIGPNLSKNNQNYISKCRIIDSEGKFNDDSDVRNYLVHYNHYERLDHVIRQQKALDSSHSRWKRGKELGEIFTTADAIKLLGDQENVQFPIFRTSNGSDVNSVTLCTAHINFLTLQLEIYQQNPKDNKQPSITYNLRDIFSSE
ncbi:unnamed protein product [Adineta ricciae]|uniref:Peptidase C45 hydrolase domain-containing protein n=1 Tax=Adineta ricciae TaxID=249248 RepID=A0A814HTV1_ADIRI|nr:unnamed protein product [Adineta ricciae]